VTAVFVALIWNHTDAAICFKKGKTTVALGLGQESAWISVKTWEAAQLQCSLYRTNSPKTTIEAITKTTIAIQRTAITTVMTWVMRMLMATKTATPLVITKKDTNMLMNTRIPTTGFSTVAKVETRTMQITTTVATNKITSI
jgi:hypothetical protein